MDLQSSVTLRTGAKMPILGLGTWKLTHETADTIGEALDMGYRMIDTSGDYGTQPGIGEGIKHSGAERESFYLVTKIEEDDEALGAARNNLSQLQLDYVDLLLIHRPPPQGNGEDLWRGLIAAKKAGLTKDIGVSNYSAEQIQALADATGEMPAVNQIEWTPFGYSDDLLDYCRDNAIVVQAYSPLTHGKRLDDTTLVSMAEKYYKSPAQLLIRWGLQRGVVPLPKANSPEHLIENLDVVDFEISRSDMALLDDLNEHYSSLGDSLQYV